MTTPKNVVRRFPPFAHFQKFLVAETSVGNISRQEVVSMIPPLLMDIRPGMTVLDMCAAPGSKAAQLIEMVHGGEEARMRRVVRRIEKQQGRELSPEGDIIRQEMREEEELGGDGDWSDDGRATGLLIANDSDYKRAHMLTHQMKRLNSPNLIVTNHDATMFPSIKLQPDNNNNVDSNSDVTAAANSRPVKYLKFDRILADVPCSGDGTCRKNSNVWKDWSPGNALGLYPTQVRILVRALQMLKVGGRVVYSTCSLHPVENEAVVASAIDRCGGSRKVTLVDCSEGDTLPLLKRKPGLGGWKVMDKQGRMWSSWDEVQEARVKSGDEGLGKLVPGMFPPSPPAADDDEPPTTAATTTNKLALDRCMRIYPHLQDTGGFFIAVLEKKSEIKARPEDSPAAAAAAATAGTVTTTPSAATGKRNSNNNNNSSSNNPKPSIVDAVNAIESQPAISSNNPLPKISALDAIAPPLLLGGSDDIDMQDPSAAARQNSGSAIRDSEATGAKRALDDEGAAATKRLKLYDENDQVKPGDDGLGVGDRRVHWPPPPAAQIDTPALPPPREIYTANGTVTDDNDASAAATNTMMTATKPPTPTPKSRKAQQQQQQAYEEPFIYLDPNHEDLQIIRRFYAFGAPFPFTRFMVRNATGTPAKTIYYTSALARSVLTANAHTGIKFVHCGVKMFVKQDVQAAGVCPWRIQSEGLPIAAGWVGMGLVGEQQQQESDGTGKVEDKEEEGEDDDDHAARRWTEEDSSEQRRRKGRVVRLWRKRTLRTLLLEMFPKVEGGGWKHLGEIGEQVRDIGMGCCVLKIGPPPASLVSSSSVSENSRVNGQQGGAAAAEKATAESEANGDRNPEPQQVDHDEEEVFGPSQRMVLPLWRSLHALNLMLPKEDRKAMMIRLFDDDSLNLDHSKERSAPWAGHGGGGDGATAAAVAAGEVDGNGDGEDDAAEDGDDGSREREGDPAEDAESSDPEEEGGVGLTETATSTAVATAGGAPTVATSEQG